MAYYLGIDGGGSKTDSAVGDETQVLGAGHSGTSKIQRVEPLIAAAALETSIRDACVAAGIAPSQIAHACFGLAGAAEPRIAAWAEDVMARVMAADSGSQKSDAASRITVVGDHVIAHEAAFGGDPGVLIIAGTGSIVYGRNSRGEEERAGGWGPMVSDEGSGNWIGRKAVAVCLRPDLDRNTVVPNPNPGCLRKAILTLWRVTGNADLAYAANSTPSPDFAGLFPLVLRCAADGDRIAQDLLQAAGRELAELAFQVINSLWTDSEAVNFALVGGVAQSSAEVRLAFAQTIGKLHSLSEVSTSQREPVLGALSLARRMARSTA